MKLLAITSICLLTGMTLATGSLFVEWTYCVAGDARGLPMAITYPGHGPVWYEFDLDGESGWGQVLDSLSLLGNLVLYSLLPGIPLALLARRLMAH